MDYLKKCIQFVKDVANDKRIPAHDKKILLTLIALIISPIDFIPDWIPVIGILDDIVMIALVFDYLFEHLDSDILLSHYPFGMKSFISIRRFSRMISWMTPEFIKSKIWKFKPDIYK